MCFFQGKQLSNYEPLLNETLKVTTLLFENPETPGAGLQPTGIHTRGWIGRYSTPKIQRCKDVSTCVNMCQPRTIFGHTLGCWKPGTFFWKPLPRTAFCLSCRLGVCQSSCGKLWGDDFLLEWLDEKHALHALQLHYVLMYRSMGSMFYNFIGLWDLWDVDGCW